MMRNRMCFLAVLLLTIVAQANSEDLLGRRTGSAADRRDRKNNDLSRNNYAHLDDDYSQQASYRRNRYPSYGSASNSYPSRSRWPASYDDLHETDDWSHHSYGLSNLLSKFSGAFPPEFSFQSGPTCHSLIDSQYPLFSDICGAVPQARYALPNSFGHLERWQIAQVLSTILDPATLSMSPPTCTRSLRLLVCPLLFPPCPSRFEAPPVLPCQPFCRAIKNQCAAPSLDLLPCDLLPPTSDLCPINPTPYSSLLSSFGQPSPFNGGLPQSALASILAQSALAQLEVPSNAFSSFLSSSNYPSAPPPPSAFSSLMSPSSMQPSPFGPSALASSPFSSLFPGAGLSPPSSNPVLNLDSYMSDSLTPILVDFPPLGGTRDFRQGSQYFPMMRSATEKA